MIKCLGLGVGLHNSFSSNRQYLPVYVLFRSNLLRNRSLFFVDFQGRLLEQPDVQGRDIRADSSARPDLGINLSVSKRFGSHLLLGYNFYQVSPFTDEKGSLPGHQRESLWSRYGWGSVSEELPVSSCK